MNKLINRILSFVLVTLCVVVTGCTKKNSSKSKTTLLTSSAWKFSTAGIDQDANGTIDIDLPPGTLQSCETDNTILLKPDFTGIADEGATKCDATDPKARLSTGAFKIMKRKLIFPPLSLQG